MACIHCLAEHSILCFLFIDTYSYLDESPLYWHQSLLSISFNSLLDLKDLARLGAAARSLTQLGR